MNITPPQMTAAQEIILAACDLEMSGHYEFSEWELTVAAWRRNRNRFGLRGFEDTHPDHKRVMTEIMGQSKKDNPVRRKLLDKVRPNYYRITDLGKAEAVLLDRESRVDKQTPRSPGPIYSAVEVFANSPPFRTWLQNPEEPKSWLGASAFLGLTKISANELNDRLRAVNASVRMALDWCSESDRDAITRGPQGGSRPIPVNELRRVPEFIAVLKSRFARQIAAILAKG